MSRKNFKSGEGARLVSNEDELEKLFASKGFSIVYPEKMGFIEQIRLVNSCQWIAGLEGSAMHLNAFMKEGGNVITINKRKEVHNQNFFNVAPKANQYTIDRSRYMIGKAKRRFSFKSNPPFIHKLKRGVVLDINSLTGFR